jgi:hypothetical protein
MAEHVGAQYPQRSELFEVPEKALAPGAFAEALLSYKTTPNNTTYESLYVNFNAQVDSFEEALYGLDYTQKILTIARYAKTERAARIEELQRVFPEAEFPIPPEQSLRELTVSLHSSMESQQRYGDTIQLTGWALSTYAQRLWDDAVLAVPDLQNYPFTRDRRQEP